MTPFEALAPPTEAAPPAPPSLLVPLDGSAEARSALPVARGLAELSGGVVHLVHVGRTSRPLPELLAALRLRPRELAGLVVDELEGSPAEQILQLAEEVARPVVVMAAHSASAAAGALGPVARAVLEEACFPVTIVRPERGAAAWALRRMVLPHDGSRRTASALGPAVSLAERAAASLLVLHVAPAPGEATPEPSRLPQYVDQPQHEWPEWTREFLERLEIFSGVAAQVPARLFLARGEPGEEILRFAARQQADLVALAWSGGGRGGAAATAREVMARCGCPVLVLRVREPARRPLRARRPGERETW